MSFEWTSQPLSIQSIASQYTLPVAIRSAPGFRGSSRPVILHSISHIKFAFGLALRANQTTTNGYTSYRPIDSEIVAIPIKYPGYFECLPSRNNVHKPGVFPETSIQSIVERMQVDHRPQAFYMTLPIRVFTIENGGEGIYKRIWHEIEAYQTIIFEKIVEVEYTPTSDDNLTDDDYAYSWLVCFGKQVLNRTEPSLQCILTQHQTCYIPCSSIDELHLIPVGQHGSTNVNKLQMISNLVEQFPLPVKVKLAQLPGSYAYQDFSGSLQVFGSRTEDFAICASLATSNIAVIPTKTPLKFVVSPLSSSSSSQIRNILSNCHIFVQSFHMQIRRIFISSHLDTSSRRARSRYPKIQAAIDQQFKTLKRSYSVNQNTPKKDDQTTTDEGYRSSSSAFNKRNNFNKQRSTSVDAGNVPPHIPRKRTSSTDDDTTSHSLVHPVRNKKKSSSSPPPPALPKKPPNFPYPSKPLIHDSERNLIDNIDLPNVNGAILMDASNELVLALPSDSRFT